MPAQCKNYSVPDGVRNGGVGTIEEGSGTEPGGSVRFNLFLDILLMLITNGCVYDECITINGGFMNDLRSFYRNYNS